MKTKYKHIHFEVGPRFAGGGVFYYCKSNRNDAILGDVTYYDDWKKYVFEGRAGCVFDTSCLADVIDFMSQLK